MKNGVNGMTLIGKAAEWVYRFCFREAVTSKKKAMPSHRFPQISYGARVAPQRCPILRMSKAITIMPRSASIIHLYPQTHFRLYTDGGAAPYKIFLVEIGYFDEIACE